MSAMLPSPADRVALSREHLRQALRSVAAPRTPATDPLTGAPTAVPWLERLKSIPGAAIAVDALGQWWARHPLRVAVALAAQTATSIAKPIAQRHPLGLVLCALLLGGLFAWSRPWRWALKPALFAGLLPQLLLSALKASPPLPAHPPVP
jgi:hypothetical protein